jgi:Activator of Hsp90 ATPase homolog 1-like protein
MLHINESIQINATAKKVWNAVTDQENYKVWTEVFAKGSYFEGSWEEGSKILFLAPDSDSGLNSGLVSVIAENRPFEFISIKHLGEVDKGVEDTTSEEVKTWAPFKENYIFEEKNGVTTFTVDMETTDEYHSQMLEMWQKALLKLKEVAEKSVE